MSQDILQPSGVEPVTAAQALLTKQLDDAAIVSLLQVRFHLDHLSAVAALRAARTLSS
jgi:hypothetical protein